MTYAQSLQNIENIKNFVSPINEDVIFFEFYNDSSFRILFFSSVDCVKYRDKLSKQFGAELALGVIYTTNSVVSLFYSDILTDYEFSFTKNEISSVCFKDFRKSDKSLKSQFLELIAELKKS